MDKKLILKKIENIEMGLLNLEIQTAQIQDDAAARGTMTAAEYLKGEVEEIKNILEGE
jgi:hypothetical protein